MPSTDKALLRLLSKRLYLADRVTTDRLPFTSETAICAMGISAERKLLAATATIEDQAAAATVNTAAYVVATVDRLEDELLGLMLEHAVSGDFLR